MKRYFTTKALADMRLVGCPTTAQGWDKLVKNHEWEFIEAHGRGRGGLRREYLPTPEILVLIEAQDRGESFQVDQLDQLGPSVVQRSVMSATPVSAGLAIDEVLLSRCLSACGEVYGEPFKLVDCSAQMGYATDFYNLLVKMSGALGGLEKMRYLESAGLVEMLKLLILMGAPKKFRQYDFSF